MSETLHEAMHADHRRWADDLTMWQDDLVAWQHELVKVTGDLDRARTALAEHGQVLEGHALQLRNQQDFLREHEEALADYERGGEPPEVVGLAATHDEQAQWHPHLRGIHERLKRYHHAIAARASLLAKALTEPV